MAFPIALTAMQSQNPKHIHIAVAIISMGQRLADAAFAAVSGGYTQLLAGLAATANSPRLGPRGPAATVRG